MHLHLRDDASTAQLLQQARAQYPELFIAAQFSRVLKSRHKESTPARVSSC